MRSPLPSRGTLRRSRRSGRCCNPYSSAIVRAASRKRGWAVTSLTRSPSSHTSRPSRSAWRKPAAVRRLIGCPEATAPGVSRARARRHTAPGRLRRQGLPPGEERMSSVVIDERTIHYRTIGDPSRRTGQRVLYVHGTGCNGGVWEPHMAAIADAHTPVAIDLPGHGESAGRAFRGIADYTYFVVELARALGWHRFVIVGHSMGGAVALLTALHHADVLAGLVLVDTGARLRVNPGLLANARAAAERGRVPAADRAWAYAAGTPQSVVDAVQTLTEGTDPWTTYA